MQGQGQHPLEDILQQLEEDSHPFLQAVFHLATAKSPINRRVKQDVSPIVLAGLSKSTLCFFSGAEPLSPALLASRLVGRGALQEGFRSPRGVQGILIGLAAPAMGESCQKWRGRQIYSLHFVNKKEGMCFVSQFSD